MRNAPAPLLDKVISGVVGRLEIIDDHFCAVAIFKNPVEKNYWYFFGLKLFKMREILRIKRQRSYDPVYSFMKKISGIGGFYTGTFRRVHYYKVVLSFSCNFF